MSKAGRLARKAARLEHDEHEAAFNKELAEALREREKALAEANTVYRKALADAKVELDVTRKKTWTKFDERRDELVKKHARAQAAAA